MKPDILHTGVLLQQHAAVASPTADFVDLPFHLTDQAHALAAIAARSPAAPFAYVATPNVDHVVRLHHRRSDLWPAYRRAWLLLCDSRILGRMAGWTGVTLPVAPGSDLTAALLREVIRPDDRVAVIGGPRARVDALAKACALTDVVHYDPPMGFIDDAEAVEHAVRFLVDSHARYSLLAVGSPQQEILAYRVERQGGATGIGLCIGASLDFLSGAQSRAPRLLQRLSLEWLFRLLSDPRRLWRRYLIEGPLVFAIVLRWYLRRRAARIA